MAIKNILQNFLFYFSTVELAMIMDRLYGGVCYAGIDTDLELEYSKEQGKWPITVH